MYWQKDCNLVSMSTNEGRITHGGNGFRNGCPLIPLTPGVACL